MRAQLFDRVLRERLDRLYDRIYGAWFAAVAWVIAVVAVVLFFDGRDGLWQLWPFLIVALGGAVVVGLGGKWWASRTRPAIMVAHFVAFPAGDDAARKRADVFREDFKAALAEARCTARLSLFTSSHARSTCTMTTKSE